MRKKYIVIYLFLFEFSVCSLAIADDCDSLDSVSWMLGNWYATETNRITKESWLQFSKNTIEGRSLVKSVDDSQLLDEEFMRLLKMGNDIFYLAKVKHNKYPIAFKLSSCSEPQLVFENAKHDFPNKITYQREANNRLSVFVTGSADKGFQVNFKKLD